MGKPVKIAGDRDCHRVTRRCQGVIADRTADPTPGSEVSAESSSHDDLLRWRREFPILERTVHLINHSLGAMPRGVYDRLREFADVWATRGIRAWAEGWWKMPGTVGDMVGGIIGAAPGQVVMHQNVSVCQSVILSCFDFSGKRNKIVAAELDFPTALYVP